ncbi:FtsX-like permease family protein [Thalassotalea litorea]|uniref:FtsX-like permease family protein n=1 Tax=Thalassotalea litorea TaxID=2020715 RepID=A0A5R9IY66_9GAMM|nr:FtsX-like permease family protein [Thalassotalea litorea]TLU68116.1 FtsX-like permease family protein [Thalassotalea litorea]
MSAWATQSWRLFRHELKRGELTIIALALIIAVASVFSLSGFSAQIKSALIQQSNSFIAADRVLQSSRPVEEKYLNKADEMGLQHAQLLQFSSMVFGGDDMVLASVKAVSNGYPLRGSLLVATPDDQNQLSVGSVAPPKQGSAYVGQSLLNNLNLNIGDRFELGNSEFTISGVIDKEPDASFSVFTSGPRVMIHVDDVPATDIVQPGSRLTYKYLFAGDAIVEYSEWAKPQILETQRFRDIKDQQSPLANALNRAESYLSLASMLGIILAAVAVSVASRRYGQRHQPMVAVYKSIGASASFISKLYLLHWGALAGFSILVGLIIGYGIQYLGIQFMADVVPGVSLTVSAYPVLVAVFTGVICAVAFAITPLRQLIATPAISVIRGFAGFERAQSWLERTPPLLAVVLLLWLFSQDLLLTTALMLGAGAIIFTILVLGHVLINAGRSVGSQAGQAFHLSMANLKRRAKANQVQLVSFTIAIQLLLLMLVVRNDLINEWQAQLPQNTPNQFLVNVSQTQVPAVEEFLHTQGLAASDLYPIVRGRLSAINEEQVRRRVSKEEEDASEQGRRGIGRELNLTWHQKLPSENEVIAGQWFNQDNPKPEVSVEQKLAERLQVSVGDELTFQIGSETVSMPVTSIRTVNWQSMQPNFYMIFSESVLADFPATYIAAIYVPALQKTEFQTFLQDYPTISIIDVDAIINQLRTVISQVSLAVEFILILVLIAGALVLVAQVQASMEERERELAILRTLGAKGSLLANSVLLEFVILGALAGLLGSLSMEIGVFILQTQVFDMSAAIHWQYWLLGTVLGAVIVGALGMASCYRLLKLSSLTLIRRTL